MLRDVALGDDLVGAARARRAARSMPSTDGGVDDLVQLGADLGPVAVADRLDQQVAQRRRRSNASPSTSKTLPP